MKINRRIVPVEDIVEGKWFVAYQPGPKPGDSDIEILVKVKAVNPENVVLLRYTPTKVPRLMYCQHCVRRMENIKSTIQPLFMLSDVERALVRAHELVHH